jgi:hypothetical protein
MSRLAQRHRCWIPALLVCLLLLEIGTALRFMGSDTRLSGEIGGNSRLSGMPFAIADFDGDWKPDLAVIETASARRVPGNYAVRLQLSAAAEVSFLVAAPSGGIRVAARDVNGDDLPDVVISSVADKRVVAILLNHGHGEFTEAEPSSFAGFSSEPDTFLRTLDESLSDRLTVASWRNSFEGARQGGAENTTVLATDSVGWQTIFVPLPSALQVCRGRSPPLTVLLA